VPNDDKYSPVLQAGDCSRAAAQKQERVARATRKIALARAKVKERRQKFLPSFMNKTASNREGEEVQVVSRTGRRVWETKQSSHERHPGVE